ncbi:MAG: hypothetical protein ACEPOZ_19960 [Marinifilaceae bacterium]
MVIYFNEAFLQEQFDDATYEDFVKSLELFNSCTNVIQEKRNKYSSKKIYFKTGMALKEFFELFTNEEDLYRILLENLGRLGLEYWNSQKIQDNSFGYFFLDSFQVPPKLIDVNNTSLAEAAELKKNYYKDDALIINLSDLKYSRDSKLFMDIISKVNPVDVFPISLDSAIKDEAISWWIEQKLCDEYKYNDFSRPPRDEETCLLNKGFYRKLDGQKEQGRQVYFDSNRRYYYVDNLHRGPAAHIEVFDNKMHHIGEASLDGVINFKKSDKTKVLDFH